MKMIKYSVAFSILLAAVFVSRINYAAEDIKNVVIGKVDGIVDVKKAGTDKWTPAETGMKLVPGDLIRTTIDSIVDLAFQDGSVLRLNEETQLQIQDFSEKMEKGRFLYFFDKKIDAKKTRIKLIEGDIMASVRKIPNSKSGFIVETPRGIAGVRGTNWAIGEKVLVVPSGVNRKTAGDGAAAVQKGDVGILCAPPADKTKSRVDSDKYFTAAVVNGQVVNGEQAGKEHQTDQDGAAPRQDGPSGPR